MRKLGARVSPFPTARMWGGYFSYGLGQVDYPACDAPGTSCSGSDLRLGLQATFTFANAAKFNPWFGLGFGWEKASDTREGPGYTYDFSYSGLEFLNLQVGGDFKVTEKFAVGPYAMITFGSYSTMEQNGVSADMNSATHEWYGFGVRGKFDL